ncbi:TPA: hypothetical protein ACGGNU_005042, partial [Escherichia coli]
STLKSPSYTKSVNWQHHPHKDKIIVLKESMKGLRKQYSFGAKTGLDTQNLNFYALRLYHHMFYRLRK